MSLFAGFGTLILILMFLIIFLSDMHLCDFLFASLDQCNIPGLRERKKVLRLVNLNRKIWQFLRQNVANFPIFVAKFGISDSNFPRCQVIATHINHTFCEYEHAFPLVLKHETCYLAKNNPYCNTDQP